MLVLLAGAGVVNVVVVGGGAAAGVGGSVMVCVILVCLHPHLHRLDIGHRVSAYLELVQQVNEHHKTQGF